ncbi:MAG: hypothetical protein ACYCV4_16265 [Dermatophilaceae bacterium]
MSEQGGQAPVERARCAATLDVAQDGDAGVLAELPVDMVKINQTSLHPLEDSSADTAFLRASI